MTNVSDEEGLVRHEPGAAASESTGAASASVPPGAVPLGEGRGDQRAAGWRGVAKLLAPVVLATAAVGAHFRLNVPDDETLAAARAQRKPAPKPPGAVQKKHERKKKPAIEQARSDTFEPRSEAELARLLRRFEGVDFDAEPVAAAWARRHQNLVNKAVVVARKHAFEGAPEEPRVIVTGTRCRTVRCQFSLRSPYAHEVELLDATIARLHADGAPLWRLHASERIDPPSGAPPDDVYLRVTVAFTRDEPDGRTLEVPAAQPAD